MGDSVPSKKQLKKNEKYAKSAKKLGLSGKVFDEINKTFCVFDKDGDGKISKSELREVIRVLGKSVSEGDLDNMMSKADADGSGYVEFAEFLPLIAVQYTAVQQIDKQVKDTFRSFDLNGDGVISAREFRQAVAKLGQNLSDGEVAEFMRSVDKDGDGVISYEEFAKYVVSNI